MFGGTCMHDFVYKCTSVGVLCKGANGHLDTEGCGSQLGGLRSPACWPLPAFHVRYRCHANIINRGLFLPGMS